MKILPLAVGGLLAFAGCGSDSSSGPSSVSSEVEVVTTTSTDSNSYSTTSEAPVKTDAPTTTKALPTTTEDLGPPDISKIGYGHYADDIYLEATKRYMSGSLLNEYSEAQLFNFARNTCQDLRNGDVEKILDILESVRTSRPMQYQWTAAMTIGAVTLYCYDVDEPFLTMARERGL